MITEVATIIYSTLYSALSGKSYFNQDNVYYRHLPDYTDFNDAYVIYDFSGNDFSETLDNNKLNIFKLVVTILLKPENEGSLYDIERSIKNKFSTLNDAHLNGVHIANTNKTYNELLDIFEKKINIDLTYVE